MHRVFKEIKGHRASFGVAMILVASLLAGCATTPSDSDDDDPYKRTKRGAMIGAAVGAAAGVFVGDGELDEVLGTAAVGAGVGAGIGLYMDKQQQALQRDLDNAEVERLDEDTLRVNFDSDILFQVDSATLSSQSKSDLDDFARVMNEYSKSAILIQGHTDSTGSEEYNMQLSERRAQSVLNHLLMRDVHESRMAAVGYGEGYPVADNSTASGRQANRRVSILVRGKA